MYLNRFWYSASTSGCLEDGEHVQEQVAEIDGVERDQTLLILGVEFLSGVVEGARLGRRDLFGRERPVLPAVNQVRQLPGGPALFIDIGGDDQLLQSRIWSSVSRIVKLVFSPHQLRMAAQKLDADRVERPEPRHAFDRLPRYCQTRFFISRAALLVKVTARISFGRAVPVDRRCAIRAVSAGSFRCRRLQA